MSYHALYRAFRPQQFQEVVGQVHIVKTVQNALKHERLSHAYLFCGPRGTGKTSIAKIIAKAVNCQQYPTSEPCNECSNCLSITKGSSADVFEIDAASNNGVDEIRDIRDKVKYAPTTGRYKVYIIDEVHMLSTGAFNALLKTLEEPPRHVIFILATTEPHKIPPTIISRCQRFDFKQISTPEIEQHLCEILGNQGVAYEAEAVQLVSQLAEGGMRDALSLLDQVISYADEKITVQDVHDLSGTVDQEQLLNVVQGLHELDFTTVVQVIQTLVNNGKEPARIIDGLISTYRDLLMHQKIGTDNENPQFIQLAQTLKAPQLLRDLFKLNKLHQELRFANHPELLLEVGLLGLTDIGEENSETSPSATTPQLTELKAEIKELKRTIKKMQTQPQIQSQKEPEPIFVPKDEPQLQLKLPKKEENIILPEHVQPDMLTLEQILNEATKGAKDQVAALLSQLSPINMPEYKAIIGLIQDGVVAAASDKGFILVYKHEPACKRILREDNKQTAEQLVAHLFGKPYPFNIVPEYFWLEQRQSYIDQKKQGLDPKLKQYSQNIKNMINYNEETQTRPKDFVDEIIEQYGPDLVNINE